MPAVLGPCQFWVVPIGRTTTQAWTPSAWWFVGPNRNGRQSPGSAPGSWPRTTQCPHFARCCEPTADDALSTGTIGFDSYKSFNGQRFLCAIARPGKAAVKFDIGWFARPTGDSIMMPKPREVTAPADGSYETRRAFSERRTVANPSHHA